MDYELLSLNFFAQLEYLSVFKWKGVAYNCRALSDEKNLVDTGPCKALLTPEIYSSE